MCISFTNKLLPSVFVFFSFFIFVFFKWKLGESPLPEIEFKHFSEETGPYDDYRIRPFKIDIPLSDLINLKEKLLTTRELSPSISGVGFSYGINSEYLKKFLEYWKTEYNWKKRESYLNQFPQFTTQIAGLNIHYIHVKPNKTLAKGKKIIPLLLIHGWPGSVIALYKLIPLLTTPQASYDFLFEVIAPSTPGNGFSEASPISGLNSVQIGTIYHRLMFRLGLENYYIHASDSGALIGHSQAVLFSEWVLGYHSNICLAASLSSILAWVIAFVVPSLVVEKHWLKNYKDVSWKPFEELSIINFISNSPDTFGIGLTDSPAALAAVILDRIASWSNYNLKNCSDGGLDSFDKNELLDIIMMYWLTKSITPSMRLYRDTFRMVNCEGIKNLGLMKVLTVPTGCVWFRNEIAFVPYFALENTYSSLVSVNYLEEGGHFPALQHPVLLSNDIWSFVNKVRTLGIKNPKADFLRYLNLVVLFSELFS
ncbi:juvenile hormone epoxide hydrolase 1 isoform X1 [Halyomorpha halys]|uniref:juvenile hormone epoxide hydrolase 1 isoform X1 n=1 Tax=Halyomorpha halys TaxID=286706 RepID=UPI0034D37C4B